MKNQEPLKESRCSPLTSNDLLCRPLPIEPFYKDDFVTIYNADCREVMNLLPAGSVRLVIADPPYGINYRSNHRREKFDKIEGDDLFRGGWLKNAARIATASGTVYVFANENSLDATKKAMLEHNFEMNTMLVWDKMNSSGGDLSDYARRCEFILHGSKRYKAKAKLSGSRDSNLISIPRVPPMTRQHPTEKPVLLLNYLVMKSCQPTEIVLDPFCGTGATLLAARQLGRKAIGIEIDERYCQIAKNRLTQSPLPF